MATSSRITLAVAYVSTSLFLLLAGAVVFAMVTGGRTQDQPDEALRKIDLKCHPGAGYESGRYEGEGWSGWYSTCSHPHGPYLVYRDGRLAIRGRYVNGLREGDFVFYAPDGSVSKRVRYMGGKEVATGTE